MRVDGHVHLWDARALRTPFPLPMRHAPLDDLLSHMAPEAIEHAVLVQPQVHGSDHELLLSAIARHPNRFVGFGLVDASAARPDGIDEQVRRIAELGLAGVRVHALNGTGRHARAVAVAASRCGLALEVHVDEAAWKRLAPLIEAAGDQLVVVDHLARPGDPGSLGAREVIRGLAGYPNVIVKLAALDVVSRKPFPHDNVLPLLAAAVEGCGAQRLMWGSNYPWCRGESYGESLRVIERLGLSNAENESILGGTAGRLLFRDQRQAVA